MNKALLSIGTNENREENLSLCHHLLGKIFTDLFYSRTSITVPYGANYKSNFLNQLALIHTDKSKDDVISLLKSIETQIGRVSSDKEKGTVKIDIDLVIWNSEVLRPVDISRSYIADLLPELQDRLLP
ncbi:2-amino-4-hydroxy-6-hydroxymethyldihydropteridine diphosphokinase [Prevotella sp. 10(H)]|uniref:2-amino-4-hydroxy-6- hydroxymethyldihydropteridine diphosphokinase n=1 Tax=Prevotella sp. 10(H) TaxID=1158294 RepID=UPI0004A75E94|nr:2-amino-4-hydroxy-6-hydroxymethyldihydropteridine diphosphokinase [Prevotella sp. 10(H)]